MTQHITCTPNASHSPRIQLTTQTKLRIGCFRMYSYGYSHYEVIKNTSIFTSFASIGISMTYFLATIATSIATARGYLEPLGHNYLHNPELKLNKAGYKLKIYPSNGKPAGEGIGKSLKKRPLTPRPQEGAPPRTPPPPHRYQHPGTAGTRRQGRSCWTQPQ